jgi:diketogulonate reductase-like aldo/keto reductase
MSLDYLGLDYIDLLLIHWPGADEYEEADPNNLVKRHETWQTMEEFV